MAAPSGIQHLPLFPNLQKTVPLLQTILSNLPKLPNLISNFQFQPPIFPFPMLNFNPINPVPKPKPCTRPRKKRNQGFKKPEAIGPPFQLDYAPHLKEAVRPRKREMSPEIIILDTPSSSKKTRMSSKSEKPRKKQRGPTLNSQNFMISNLLPQPAPVLPPLITAPMLQIPFPGHNFIAPMTPNQQAYSTLENAYPSWKYNYFKKRALIVHTNCLLKRRMCWLLKKPEMTQELWDIERRFRCDKINLLVRLTPEEHHKICLLFLRNCVDYGKVLDEKEKEMEPEQFCNWMETQLNYEPVKPYYLTTLPTFREVLMAISDSFRDMNLIDCSQNQKQLLINFLQFDWTNPTLDPQRLQLFSNIIELSVERITEIMDEARKKLKNLIYVRDYYWCIDRPLPPFDY